jgi:bis(5'-nucleosidyl)-tetraphosphatase
MPYEYSAGAVIFRRENNQLLYLLLHYEEGHWGCSKGHIEKGETIEATARREIREETGLTDISFIPGFKELNQYFFVSDGQRIHKTVTFLLAETTSSLVILSDEHIAYAWLPYAEALERITFKNEKAVFNQANHFVLSLP